jgi:hypothetical protein
MAKAIQPFVVEVKNQQLSLSKIFSKKILLLAVGVFILSAAGYSQAGPYFSQAGGGTMDGTILTNWKNASNASPTSFDYGDEFIIQSGDIVTTSAPWELSTSLNGSGQAELEISPGATFSPNFSLDMAGIFSNDGVYNNNSQAVTLDVGAILQASQPTVFDTLTVNAGTLGGANTVYIDPNNPTTITIQDGGVVNLTNGYLDVGASNVLALTGSATFNVNQGFSDISNPADGTGLHNSPADPTVGGTVALNGTSGDVISVLGGDATFYNMTTTGGDGNVRLNLGTQYTTINGTLTIKGANSNLFAVQNHSPVWGKTSTLSINNNGQAYSPGLEWLPLASGTSGSTPGYPNNVVLMNMGNSLPGGVGFDPTGGPWTINGTLSIGNGAVTGKASVADMTLFTSGGISINNGSLLKGNNIVDNGNWSRSGASIGTYSSTAGGTVTFAGTGTPVSPESISVSSGTETEFSNIAIDNDTYVKLFSPVTIPPTGTVTFGSGHGFIETSASHLLSVTNTSPSAISGGSILGYVNGPLQWTFAAGSSNSYLFPVGAATSNYYPFTIVPNSTGTNATVQAFHANSGGTPDGTTVAIISLTEYWKMTTSSSLNSGSSVSLDKSAPVAPYNRIAESATQTGVYSSIGGTVMTTSIDSSNDIGTASPFFFVFGDTTYLIPVRFVDINALAQANHTLVQWQVADQSGIATYVVQKSTDDIHFTTIGQVPATASLSYNYTDASPAAGYNYYKIESIANSGSADYSSVASVQYGSGANTSDAFIAISPNPVTGSSIGIKMSDVIPSGVYVVSLTNAAGQNIYNTNISHVAGNGIETITPTTPLEPGTYYLSLSGLSSTGNDRYSLKVIVVH